MNFFEAQARAQRNTGWLLALLTLAVACLIAMTMFLLLGVYTWLGDGGLDFSAQAFRQHLGTTQAAVISLLVILFVFLGSLYKTLSLAGGGRSVAELLGGTQIAGNTGELTEKRLLNVVEEMAIASGIPVPPVYVLEEGGINAFAAGWSPNDAVIGVTRGAITHLNRDELQGVIAHEFGHIFNGDMRLNIRLIGVLHGILLIGLTGEALLRGMRYVRGSGRNRGGAVAVILVLGVGLVVIGYAGHFFGQWIKSVISRQREYLADATAVRYTRNRDGIAGALKKIGGWANGSGLNVTSASEYSHACFSEAVSGFLQGMFPTHPPLKDRIRRIDPGWNGVYTKPAPVAPESAPKRRPVADAAVLGGVVAAGLLQGEALIKRIGTLSDEQVNLAREVIAAMPAGLRQALEEPFGARAVIYAMLLDQNAAARAPQEAIIAREDMTLVTLVERWRMDLQVLPVYARLPLLELAMPALRALSKEQYTQFRAQLEALIKADGKVNFREWMVEQALIQPLDVAFGVRPRPSPVHSYLGAVKREAEILLSLVAQVEHAEDAAARNAFQAAIKEMGTTAFAFVPRAEISLDALNKAVYELNRLKPLAKPRLLKGCAAVILFDGKVTVKGQELLRTVASALDSPMPPLSKEPAL